MIMKAYERVILQSAAIFKKLLVIQIVLGIKTSHILHRSKSEII